MLIDKTYSDIKDMIESVYEAGTLGEISFVGKHDTARRILKEIILLDDMLPYSIEITSPTFDYYEGEFVVSCVGRDVYCEKLFRDNEYIGIGSKYIFVMPDCSDNYKNSIDLSDDSVYFMIIFDKFDEDDDGAVDTKCATVSVTRNKKGEVDGFLKNWSDCTGGADRHFSFSFFSNDNDELKRVAELMGVKI